MWRGGGDGSSGLARPARHPHDGAVERQAVLIDCDPGVDDAVALLLAFACGEALDILGVTVVAGNVPLELTARNARVIRTLAGREDVPVFAGAARPLVRPPAFDATHGPSAFHGESGLGNLPLVEPGGSLAEGEAATAIARLAMARPAGMVTLVALGPLTNVALALAAEPGLAAHLKRIVLMGGARSAGGNITPSAEFNIYADPDAAQAVFASGAKIVAHGLDVTHKVRATPERIARIAAIGTPRATAVAELLRFSHAVALGIGNESAPLHDPCPIVWLLAPELFTTRPARVEVETASDLTRGHTAAEFRVNPATAPVQWVVDADADGVFALLEDRLAR